jgi:hypothetical protein
MEQEQEEAKEQSSESEVVEDSFEGAADARRRSPLHKHRAANSTSTLFVNSTITQPDPTELIRWYVTSLLSSPLLSILPCFETLCCVPYSQCV